MQHNVTSGGLIDVGDLTERNVGAAAIAKRERADSGDVVALLRFENCDDAEDTIAILNLACFCALVSGANCVEHIDRFKTPQRQIVRAKANLKLRCAGAEIGLALPRRP